jgi:hypothetical protein
MGTTSAPIRKTHLLTLEITPEIIGLFSDSLMFNVQ